MGESEKKLELKDILKNLADPELAEETSRQIEQAKKQVEEERKVSSQEMTRPLSF